MNEDIRMAVRKEVALALEEKEKVLREEQEKSLRILPVMIGGVCLLTGGLISFTVDHNWMYVLCFVVFFLLGQLGCHGIVKTKHHPEAKKILLIYPCLLYFIGMFLPLALLEYGIL